MGVRRRKVVCADWLSWLPRPSQPPEYHQSTTNPTDPNPVTRWQAAMAPQPRACLTLPTVMHVCSAIMNELRHLHISLALVAQFAGVKRGVQRPSAPHSSPVQPEFISELHPCVPMASQPRCWFAKCGELALRLAQNAAHISHSGVYTATPDGIPAGIPVAPMACSHGRGFDNDDIRGTRVRAAR